jgi:hypothetical protein
MSLPDHLVRTLAQELAGKRIAPDVSVLLAGVLDADSPSQRTLAAAKHSTIVLSDHVEELAGRVLAHNAPHLTGNFNDGLLRLGVASHIERVAADGPIDLPVWCSALSREDRRVLAGAVCGSADRLFTHDAEFFKGEVPRLVVQSPGTFAWNPLESANVRSGTDSFTFLGWFYPQWNSEAVAGTDLLFFIFEIAGFMQLFYQASTREYRLRWHTPSGATGGMRLPQIVSIHTFNFVAVTCAKDQVTLFVNGETRRAAVRLGPRPVSTTFHPFMSAKSEHQINGGCQFRIANSAYSEKALRRHLVSRSIELTDGELQFARWAKRSNLILAPKGAFIVPPSE